MSRELLWKMTGRTERRQVHTFVEAECRCGKVAWLQIAKAGLPASSSCRMCANRHSASTKPRRKPSWSPGMLAMKNRICLSFEKARQGDSADLIAITSEVTRMACHKLGRDGRVDLDDVRQEMILSILPRLDSIATDDVDDNPFAYLYSTARRLCLRELSDTLPTVAPDVWISFSYR